MTRIPAGRRLVAAAGGLGSLVGGGRGQTLATVSGAAGGASSGIQPP